MKSLSRVWLAWALATTIVGVFTVSGPTPARAGGRTGLSMTDARAKVINKFWNCIHGRQCPASQVFRGQTALKDWRQAQRKLGRIKVLRTTMVTQVPARWRAKYKRRWGKYVQQLAAAGYKKSALQRLGLGRSIVVAKPRVALGFMAIRMERRGRVKTEHLFLVLWKVNRRWYVAYFEDSPRKITRFLIAQKPH